MIKKLFIGLTLLLLLTAFCPQSPMETQTREGDDKSLRLILFSEFQRVDIYGTDKDGRKKIVFTVDPIVDSMEIDERYLFIEAYKSNDSMIWGYVDVTIRDSSPFNDVGIVSTIRCHGWIYKDNLAVYPYSSYDDKGFELFNSIDGDTCAIHIDWEDELPHVLRVVDIDIESQWVQIVWEDNKRYWIPPKYQCTEHYTGCAGG